MFYFNRHWLFSQLFLNIFTFNIYLNMCKEHYSCFTFLSICNLKFFQVIFLDKIVLHQAWRHAHSLMTSHTDTLKQEYDILTFIKNLFCNNYFKAYYETFFRIFWHLQWFCFTCWFEHKGDLNCKIAVHRHQHLWGPLYTKIFLRKKCTTKNHSFSKVCLPFFAKIEKRNFSSGKCKEGLGVGNKS